MNCYIVGSECPGQEQGAEPFHNPAPGDAVIIDPGCMNETILRFIEDNDFNLRGVLLTHDHINHIRGLQTLKRIYDADIYAMNQLVLDQKTVVIQDMDILYIGPFRFEVISIPGHSPDSAVFKIGRLLFTGDVLSAGLVGNTASTYGATIQMTALRNKILSLPGDFTILPGHGPPSSLEAERRFNAGIQLYEEKRNKPRVVP
ncbi:MAG: MBL fold metallo-hydrolase [Treponema sp.]|jgi:glyoxylase-like metal-dependent hydrolase (beta-lactamase superfamily II)|nr:MBL fold metallo-hydrolase [Treponema sp.]